MFKRRPRCAKTSLLLTGGGSRFKRKVPIVLRIFEWALASFNRKLGHHRSLFGVLHICFRVMLVMSFSSPCFLYRSRRLGLIRISKILPPSFRTVIGDPPRMPKNSLDTEPVLGTVKPRGHHQSQSLSTKTWLLGPRQLVRSRMVSGLLARQLHQ